MGSPWQTSVVLITSSDPDESSFGTGFVIDKDEQTTYLLTCTHVVRDAGGPVKIEVYGTQARVIASDAEEGADLAVLCVEGLPDIPPLPLCATSEKGKSFSTAGFQLDGKRFVIRELHGKLGEQVGVQMRGQADRLRAWDLEITDIYLLQPGYSGSPAVDEYGNVIGVVNTRRGEGKTGVAISIEALRKVWPEMPRDLFAHRVGPPIDDKAVRPHPGSAISPTPVQTHSVSEFPLRSEPTFLCTRASHSRFSSTEQQYRERLIWQVHDFWIRGVFEKSLHNAALITLGLQESPEAVENPWRLLVQESEQASASLPIGTRITEVYDEAHGELLILGEPGAGKTTLLLELARDLLNRAEQELAHPIPVVFNLSSWTRKRQPLTAWLIEELETKYRVPRKVGSDWINANQILPLLDGLDEVDAPFRAACMQAINEYHQAHSLVPLVVCCRVHEYLSQANQLGLSHAITIQPLTTEQVHEYLVHIGEQVASLHISFQRDPVLQELVTTPLMLTILILAYQGSSLEEIEGDASAEVRKPQIFTRYTQRMLQRRSARSRYSPQQTVHWLSYLACQMKRQGQTIFYVERMQPIWLQKKWQRRLYHGIIVGPICGLLVGLANLGTLLPFPLLMLTAALIVGLLFGWASELEAEKKGTNILTRTLMRGRQSFATALENRVITGVIAGLIVGISSVLYEYLVDYSDWPFGDRIAGALGYGLLTSIYLGLPLGLAIRLDRRIEPMEALSWSWSGIRRKIFRWLLIGIVIGLVFTLPFTISSQDLRLEIFLVVGLSAGFYFVLIITLVSGIRQGLSRRLLDKRDIVSPNQGIWRSARYGVFMAIISGVVAGVFTGLVDFISLSYLSFTSYVFAKPTVTDYSIRSTMSHLLGFHPVTVQGFWALDALFWGLIGGTTLGLAVGLYCGGAAYMQHFVLRFMLWCTRYIPFNYPRFLDYAAERILLRKVGGGYIFIHGLLLEYFASEEKSDLRKPSV